MRLRRLGRILPLAALALVLVAGCGGDDDGGGGGGGELVFGTSADPVVLDGALVSDGESLRALDQMFEGLVTLKEGTTEVVPGLAPSWEADEAGTAWTFNLRDGVKFHDGEPFNAEAVCFNFDRWYNFKGPFQLESATYYWQTVFGGFSDKKKPSLYKSCEATDETTVVLNLTKPSSSFLGALALTNFTFASPKALQEFGADEGSVDEETGFKPTGTYGTEHPTGTGPFKFESWTRGDRLVMVRNDDYWGDKAKLERAHLPADRRQRCAPPGAAERRDPGLRPRRAAGHGDDRGRRHRSSSSTGPRSTSPTSASTRRCRRWTSSRCGRLLPTVSTGRPSSTTSTPAAARWRRSSCRRRSSATRTTSREYTYDPAKAKSLLQKAGVQLPLEIDFWYPTDVSRPYMPDPKRNFEAFAASLNKSGFKVKPHSAPWSPDYLGAAQEGKAGHLHLLGWTGDYGDPDNFIGVFFQQPTDQFGFTNDEISNDARRGGDRDGRGQADGALPGGEPADHGLPAGRPLRAHEAGARVRLERQGLRAEPGVARAVLDRRDRRVS